MPFGSREPRGDQRASRSTDSPDQHGRAESKGSARGSIFNSIFGGGTRPDPQAPDEHVGGAQGPADRERDDLEPEEAARQYDRSASSVSRQSKPRWSMFGGRGSPGKQAPDEHDGQGAPATAASSVPAMPRAPSKESLLSAVSRPSRLLAGIRNRGGGGRPSGDSQAVGEVDALEGQAASHGGGAASSSSATRSPSVQRPRASVEAHEAPGLLQMPTVAEQASGEPRPRDIPGLSGRRGDLAAGLTGPLSEAKGCVVPDEFALRLGISFDSTADAAAFRILKPLLLRPLPTPWQVRPLPTGGSSFHHKDTTETQEHHPLLPFFEELLAFLRSRPEEPVAEALRAQVSLESSGNALRRRFGVWEGPFDRSPIARGAFRQRGGQGVRQTDPSLEAAADVAARLACWHHLWQHLTPQEPFPMAESTIAELSLNLGRGVVFPAETDDEAEQAPPKPDEEEAAAVRKAPTTSSKGSATEAPLKRSPRAARIGTDMLDSDDRKPQRPDDCDDAGDDFDEDEDYEDDFEPPTRTTTAYHDDDEQEPEDDEQEPEDDEQESEVHAVAALQQGSAPPAPGTGQQQQQQQQVQQRASAPKPALAAAETERAAPDGAPVPQRESPKWAQESGSAAEGQGPAAADEEQPDDDSIPDDSQPDDSLPDLEPPTKAAPTAAELGPGAPEAAPATAEQQGAPPPQAETVGLEHSFLPKESTADWAARALRPLTPLQKPQPESAVAPSPPRAPGLDRERPRRGLGRTIWSSAPTAAPVAAVANAAAGADAADAGEPPAAAQEPPPADDGAPPPAEDSAPPPAEDGEQPPADDGAPPPAEDGAPPPAEDGAPPPAEGGEQPPTEGGEQPLAEEAEQVAPAADERAQPALEEDLPAGEPQGGEPTAAAEAPAEQHGAEAPAEQHDAEVSAFSTALQESTRLFSSCTQPGKMAKLAASQPGTAETPLCSPRRHGLQRLELPAHARSDNQIEAPATQMGEYDIATEGACARPPTPVKQDGLPRQQAVASYLAAAAPPPAAHTVRPFNVRRRSASPPRRPATLPGLLGRRSNPRPDSASPSARRWPEGLLPVRAPLVAEMGAKAVKGFLSRACGTMQMAMATFDPSGDGFFDYEEFEAGLRTLGYDSSSDIRDIFNVLDKRQHHVLTLSDLINSFKGGDVYEGVPQPLLPAIGAGILQEVLDSEVSSIVQEVLGDAVREELLAPKGPAKELPNLDIMLTRLGHKQEQERRRSSLTASMVPSAAAEPPAAGSAENSSATPRTAVQAAEQQLLGAAPPAAASALDPADQAPVSEGAAPTPDEGDGSAEGDAPDEEEGGLSETTESDGDGSVADLGYGAPTPRESTASKRTSILSELPVLSYRRFSDSDGPPGMPKEPAAGSGSPKSAALVVPARMVRLSHQARQKVRTAITVAQGADDTEEDELDKMAEPGPAATAAEHKTVPRTASAPSLGAPSVTANSERTSSKASSKASSKSKDNESRSKRRDSPHKLTRGFRRQATRGTEFTPAGETLPEVAEAVRQFSKRGSAPVNRARRGSLILLHGMQDVEGDSAEGRQSSKRSTGADPPLAGSPARESPTRRGSSILLSGMEGVEVDAAVDEARQATPSDGTQSAGARGSRSTGTRSAPGSRGSAGRLEGRGSREGTGSITAYPGRLSRVRSIMQHTEALHATLTRDTVATPPEASEEAAAAGPPQDRGRAHPLPSRRRADRHRNKFSGFGFAEKETEADPFQQSASSLVVSESAKPSKLLPRTRGPDDVCKTYGHIFRLLNNPYTKKVQGSTQSSMRAQELNSTSLDSSAADGWADDAGRDEQAAGTGSAFRTTKGTQSAPSLHAEPAAGAVSLPRLAGAPTNRKAHPREYGYPTSGIDAQVARERFHA